MKLVHDVKNYRSENQFLTCLTFQLLLFEWLNFSKDENNFESLGLRKIEPQLMKERKGRS